MFILIKKGIMQVKFTSKLIELKMVRTRSIKSSKFLYFVVVLNSTPPIITVVTAVSLYICTKGSIQSPFHSFIYSLIFDSNAIGQKCISEDHVPIQKDVLTTMHGYFELTARHDSEK